MTGEARAAFIQALLPLSLEQLSDQDRKDLEEIGALLKNDAELFLAVKGLLTPPVTEGFSFDTDTDAIEGVQGEEAVAVTKKQPLTTRLQQGGNFETTAQILVRILPQDLVPEFESLSSEMRQKAILALLNSQSVAE